MNRLIILCCVVGISSCNRVQETPPEVRVSETMLSQAPYLADNSTNIIMELVLEDKYIARNEVVKVTTSHGSLFALNTSDFTPTVQEIDLNVVDRVTQFILRTGVVSDQAYVTATADKVTGFNTVFFENSFAESISIAVSKTAISLDTGEQLNIEATLAKSNGSVSQGQTVTFSVSDNLLGTLDQQIVSGVDGKAVSVLTPLAVGTIDITASVLSVSGPIISNTITINIAQ